MQTFKHVRMCPMCCYECLSCPLPDCLRDDFPIVDLDEYMQFERDCYEVQGRPKAIKPTPAVEPEKGLYEAMRADLRQFCDQHGVKPRIAADVEILARAMDGGYTGKKLEKALYKVRHREKYLDGKKRNRARKEARRTVRHA